MKKQNLFLSIAAILIHSIIGFGQTIEWKWARGGGGADVDSGRAVSVDLKRNQVYAVGNFRSTVLNIGTQSMSNNGLSDFFVAKYDTAGNFIWAKNFGGPNEDYANGIEVDSISGAVYICGTYTSSTQIGTSSLSSSGSNFFLLKLDLNGNVQWVKSGINSSLSPVDEYGIDLSVLSTGDVVMVGNYFSTASDILTIDNQTLQGGTNANQRLWLKVNTSGNILQLTRDGGFQINDLTRYWDRNKTYILERDNNDNLYLGYNRNGLEIDLGGSCGGLVPQVYSQPGWIWPGWPPIPGFYHNFTVLQYNSSLNRTNMHCRSVVPPHPSCSNIAVGYHTEMMDMARDVNGNIFVSFKYTYYQGPGIGGVNPCTSNGTGIKRIIAPGNTGSATEKFNMPVDGKMAIYNNRILFHNAVIVSLYDFETQSQISALNGSFEAQDIVFMLNPARAFVTGYYTGSPTIGPDILPSYPSHNFLLAGVQLSCVSPPSFISGQTNFCPGNSVTLTAPSGFSYLWNTGATSQSINVNTAGTYSVNISSACGSSVGSVTVNQVNQPPVPVISASGPTTYCDVNTLTLSAPAGYLSYLWSNGQTSQAITAPTSGNYTVTVSNGAGCAATSSPVSVTVNPAPPAFITASGPTTICQGSSVTLSAPAGFSYLWNNGATTQSVNITTSGSFWVTVTSSTGCSRTSGATVVNVLSSPPLPNITTSGSTTICAGGSVTLTAPSGFSYLWSNGATSQSIVVTTAGNYFVTVTWNNGCSSTSLPVTVAVNTPVAQVTATGPTTFCSGGSVTLSANPSPGASYLWSNGATTQSINVTTAGFYSVTVSISGCSATSVPVTVSLFQAPPVPLISANGPTTFCQGGAVTLTAPAGFAYLWSNGATTQSITVNNSGNYNLRVTNTNNCSSLSANTTVTVNPLPTIPVITQVGNVLSSTPATTYQWYFNGSLIPGATSQSYTYSTGGDYTVTVTNAQGCSATSVVYTAMRNAIVTLDNNERFYFSLFPNPVTTNLSINYTIEQAHRVGIRLINTQGRTITIQSPTTRSAGSYTVNANAIVERIWTGVYILEFTVDGKKVTRMIIKL